jgi:flavin reductase (DIM6/NTAB) family NADH-FMN oxidoreductase RutF/DNA-binding MarR family transcriptional regulator
MSFQSVEFRQTLGTFATGITVITAEDAGGNLAGVTANSFTSVSLDPPLILWCLATSSDSLAIFRSAHYFAVNVLASDQKSVSDHFAKRQKNKFETIEFTRGKEGSPLLAGCVAWLQCRTVEQHEVGDHWVFVGKVEEFSTTGKEALLYHHGAYAISLPLPGTEPASHVAVQPGSIPEENLYSLLLQAIHTYQEKFESKQHQVVANKYEARILSLLRDQDARDSRELGQSIQVPRPEMTGILEGMKKNGLVKVAGMDDDGHGTVTLTPAGRQVAERLYELTRQHEADALELMRNGGADGFRQNLVKLINWGK